MTCSYRITYQTEDGLVKQTTVQAKTKKEADELAEEQVADGHVLYAKEANFYMN
ncbi:hypothetical protein [Lentibacillus sediminis]|uniref:hypothetical protein n=1 Tax=Lentibacillus sediminis TaxID=1940529 RepID=UPI001303F574|nr:hypothetical protein [Lentibacillus sediminis]